MFVQSMAKRSWIFFFFKPLPRNCFLATRPLPAAAAALATTPRFFCAGLAVTALTVFSSLTATGSAGVGAGAGAAFGAGAALAGATLAAAGFFASSFLAATGFLASSFLAGAAFFGCSFLAGAIHK